MNYEVPFYSIVFPDFSAHPHFPRLKHYYGTLEMIGKMMDKIAGIDFLLMEMDSTLEAFWEFINGYEDAVHCVKGFSCKLLQPAIPIALRISEATHPKWNHRDVNGKLYNLEADHAHFEEVLFRTADNMFVRCVRPRLRNVTFYRDGVAEPVFGNCRGFPGIFDLFPETQELEMNLFVEEMVFSSEEEATKHMGERNISNMCSISLELLGDVRTF